MQLRGNGWKQEKKVNLVGERAEEEREKRNHAKIGKEKGAYLKGGKEAEKTE